MPVEDIFSITGRGTVATGRIERGIINSGDTNNPTDVFLNFAELLGLGGPFATATALITALEDQGLVKILAQPNLTAISGETASFQVGGRQAIQQLSSTGSPSTIFQNFGIIVEFTPVVLSSNLISMQISAELSRPIDTEGSLAIRSAQTTVEIPSGGGLVIAGLLESDYTNTVSGLPFLKDLPIFGSLFRTTNLLQDETELVITVSPFILRAVGSAALALPTDGFAPASDADNYLLGRLHGMYVGQERPPTVSSLQGPIGYIME